MVMILLLLLLLPIGHIIKFKKNWTCDTAMCMERLGDHESALDSLLVPTPYQPCYHKISDGHPGGNNGMNYR
jgi:hypothetical protein